MANLATIGLRPMGKPGIKGNALKKRVSQKLDGQCLGPRIDPLTKIKQEGGLKVKK